MSSRKKSARKRVTRRSGPRQAAMLRNDPWTFLLGFRTEDGFVNLIGKDGGNIPLFPTDRLNENDLSGSMRSVIVTLMQDS